MQTENLTQNTALLHLHSGSLNKTSENRAFSFQQAPVIRCYWPIQEMHFGRAWLLTVPQSSEIHVSA